jgi:hypothetical protein
MDTGSIFERELETIMAHRHFFGLNAAGIGTAALEALPGKDLPADTAQGLG